VLQPRWQPRAAVPFLVVVAVAGICFARLIAAPGALIVDGSRPSVDHANPGLPRGVGNDLTFSFLPHHVSIERTIRIHGHVPLWDDRGFGGRPLAANPQGGIFYPPVWLVWWSGAPAALGWLTVVHLIWGAIGMYVLVRSMSVGGWSATVAAAIYEASPFLMAHTFEGHYPHVWAACWYPWAFWAYRDLRARRARAWVLLPGILALTSVTGHPQEWFLLILALSTWVIHDSWRAGRSGGWREAFLPLAGWGGVFLLSIGIAAVALVPELAVRPWLAHNPDVPVGLEIPRRYHLWILNAWQLLRPTALGGPTDYFGDDNYWETVLSIGLVPLVLAVLGAFRHPDRRLVRGWLVLLGLTIWLACGRHLGLFTVAYIAVPGMSWFRVPARALFLANVAAAVLAGLGVETLRKHMPAAHHWRKLRSWFIGVVVLLLAGLIAILVTHKTDGSSRAAAASLRVLTSVSFWVTLCGAAALIHKGSRARRHRVRRRAAGLIGLLAVCELAGSGLAIMRVQSLGSAAWFLGAGEISPAILRLERESHRSGPVRVKARDSAFSDLEAAVSGIEKTNVNDVFQLDHAARLYRILYPVASFQRRRLDFPMQDAVDEYQKELRQAVFDRLSVRYLVSDDVESDPGWPLFARQTSCLSPSWVIQRNQTAMPRAYVVPGATVHDETEWVTIARFREVSARRTVFMNVDPLADVPTGPRQLFTPALWASLDPDHPVLEVTTGAPGLLVISDTWMPGWSAQVDGEPTPIYLGNVAQRVIPLSRPGRHRIALDYHAPGFVMGGIVTAFSIAIWMLIALRVRGRTADNRGVPRPKIWNLKRADYADCVKSSGPGADL
jgi:hypothetical protein